MKTSTIHTSALGDVVNPSSATGFRVEDIHGCVVELRSESGQAVLRAGRFDVSVQFIIDLLKQKALIESARPRGKSITGVWVDELFSGDKSCYECHRPANWLAPDSRCGDCTRLTVEQVTGQ